jgi:hypothetical protein
MFEEVGDAHLGARFVTAGGPDPEARCGRPNATEAFGDHDKTIAAVSTKERVVELDGTH